MSGELHEKLRLKAIAWLKRYQWQDGGGCSIVLSEMVSANSEQPDAIGWSYGVSTLVECKASRADFLADAKKIHRILGGMGDHRYFLAPEGMLSPDEMPDGWGLLELQGRSVKTVKKAKRRELSHGDQSAEKRMLLSAISRIRMREFLIISKDACNEALGCDGDMDLRENTTR